MPTMDELVGWVERNQWKYLSTRRNMADDLTALNKEWQFIVAEMIHDYVVQRG